MELTFQQVTEEDLPAIYELYRKTVLSREDPTVADLRVILQGMQTSLQARRERMEKAVLEGETVGYCSIRPEPDGTVLLEDLTVLPAVRRRGIGTAILDHCMQKADGMVYRYIYVSGTAEMPFYEHNGFQAVRMVSPTRCVMARDPAMRRSGRK